ncbi:VOC family protein [Cocleimonas flava]|uniref:2-oxoadipate dioxygenase/decarboxylase n=1 Tax=Cocleimonas flava TaxID=634765 RepID=A0A4R1F5C3_9GAMM|nr:VOC family protein [Cocleimonas flava]TCJ89073.1 putative glyoxalase superfamily metalloenzyme YdcJ [Cocleimonas flava]
MTSSTVLSKDKIRQSFAAAMSDMYQQEVPEYGRLLSLVKQSNNKFIQQNSITLSSDEDALLAKEHHGAIRVGTAEELSALRRVFNVMGMFPVDYYDLSVAGIPVHSTAFRALEPEQLLISPFRVFTSLLRLDLIADEALREEAQQILSTRNIVTDELVALLDKSESQGGLNEQDAAVFVAEALEIFRWHQQANVKKEQYDALNNTHRLVADVVSFKGPHINHLTPKVLDIDEIQSEFKKQGFKAKAVVEGPPNRDCDILLRQTSFIALDEAVSFTDGETGTHTARFGEVEQRGIALTPKGRALYDELLNLARSNKSDKEDHATTLQNAFADFPDSYEELRKQELAYFNYFDTKQPCCLDKQKRSLEALIESGNIDFKPIRYEDFLPVSAAGIFTSNLAQDNEAENKIQQSPNQDSFEKALGTQVVNAFDLYQSQQQASIERALAEY